MEKNIGKNIIVPLLSKFDGRKVLGTEEISVGELMLHHKLI